MRHIFCLPLLIACAVDSPSGSDQQPGATSLHTSGSFVGRYDVPTSPSLEPAAQFFVDHIDWTTSGDTATLHYELPVGLVGGEVSVTLTGTIDATTNTATVRGPVGTGHCTIEGSVVRCHEMFMNLGGLPISLAVIEARARVEYAGPVQDRVTVATMFASEPIGIAIFDLKAPSLHDANDDSSGEDDAPGDDD